MLVPYEVWSELHETMKKLGIEVSPVNPIYQLASSEHLLEALRNQKDQIIGSLRKKYRKSGETLLEHIMESVEKMKKGIAGEDPAIRNILLSYTLLVMKGNDVHDILVKEALAKLPELHDVVINDKAYVVISPTKEELEEVRITHGVREQVKSVLTNLLQNSNVLQVNAEAKVVKLLGLTIPITRPEPLARLLYEIGKRDEAFTVVSSHIKNIVDKRLSAYVEDVNFKPLDDVEFVVRKTQFNVPQEMEDILRKASIRIKGKISYKDMKLYNVYAEIDSEIGIIRIPQHDCVFDGIYDMVRNAVDSIDIFLRRDAPVVLSTVSEARKHGYRFYRAGYNTDKGLDISFEKESLIPIGSKTGKVKALIRVEKEWPLIEKVTARIEVDTGSASVKPALLNRLRELNIEKEYSLFAPSVTDAGKTGIVITLSTANLEDAVKILDATSIIAKDVETILRTVATQQTQALSQKLTEENHMGLYVLLGLVGVKNVLDKMSEYTGRTPTGLQRLIRNYLERRNIHVDPEVIVKEPERIVEELIRRNIITFNENLEVLIGNKKLSELLSPYKSLVTKHDLSVLIDMATRKAIQMHYAVKMESVILHLMNRGTVSIDVIAKHIEAGAPVEVEVLKTKLGGKTVWEQLPSQIKLKELKLLPVEQVIWIEKDSSIPKTRTDYSLIIEAVCRGNNPSRCTEYIVSSHPDYLGIPRTLRVVEHMGEKWIDAGMYRMQIQKIVSGTGVFKIEEKLTGKIMFVKAKTIREALYKATVEDVEEVTY